MHHTQIGTRCQSELPRLAAGASGFGMGTGDQSPKGETSKAGWVLLGAALLLAAGSIGYNVYEGSGGASAPAAPADGTASIEQLRAAAEASGLAALADDSGLSVAALDGRPGVYTADWAERQWFEGDPGRDWYMAMGKVEGMLQAKGPDAARAAWFSCVLAIAWPDGETAVYEGRVDGSLTWPPRGKLGFGVADAQHVALMHHDALRVAAQGVAGGVGNGAVVGADHAVAVVFQAAGAIITMLTTVDNAANTDQITDLVTRHMGAHGTDPANDFVAWYTGKLRALPLGAHLVQVRVANTAEGNVDLHIVGARSTASDLQRFEGFVAGIGAISVD